MERFLVSGAEISRIEPELFGSSPASKRSSLILSTSKSVGSEVGLCHEY